MARPLVLHRPFGPLWCTLLLVVFTDFVVLSAVVELVGWWAYPSFLVPVVLAASTAGQIVDRRGLERTWARAHGTGLLGGGLAALGLATDLVPLAVGGLALLGLRAAAAVPCAYVLTGLLVDLEEVVRAIAWLVLATGLGLSTALGASTLVGAPLCASAAAVGALVVSRAIPVPQGGDPEGPVGTRPLRHVADIVGVARSSRPILLSLLGIGTHGGIAVTVIATIPAHARDVLVGSEEVMLLCFGAIAIGLAIGVWLCGRLSGDRLELGLVPLGALGMTLACLDLWWMGMPWEEVTPLASGAFVRRPGGLRVLADLVTMAASWALYVVPMLALVSLRAEPGRRGRVFAAVQLAATSGMVMGLGLSTLPLTQRFGVLAASNALAALVVFGQVQEYLIRFLIWVLSHVVYRVEVTGQEHLPRQGPALVVANHVSFIDWFVLAGALRRPVHFVMDVSFAHLPVLAWFARQEMVIPIASPKRDEVAYEQAFVTIRRKLREGWVVGLFPEGGLTPDGKLQPLKHGVLRVLERDPVPVVPVALSGLWGSWFSRRGGPAMSRLPSRFWSRIEVTIGPQVPPQEVTLQRISADLEKLAAGRPP